MNMATVARKRQLSYLAEGTVQAVADSPRGSAHARVNECTTRQTCRHKRRNHGRGPFTGRFWHQDMDVASNANASRGKVAACRQYTITLLRATMVGRGQAYQTKASFQNQSNNNSEELRIEDAETLINPEIDRGAASPI